MQLNITLGEIQMQIVGRYPFMTHTHTHTHNERKLLLYIIAAVVVDDGLFHIFLSQVTKATATTASEKKKLN